MIVCADKCRQWRKTERRRVDQGIKECVAKCVTTQDIGENTSCEVR